LTRKSLDLKIYSKVLYDFNAPAIGGKTSIRNMKNGIEFVIRKFYHSGE